MNQKKNMVTSTKLNMHKLNCELVSEFGLNTFWQDGIWNNLDIKLYLHISSIISGNAQYTSVILLTFHESRRRRLGSCLVEVLRLHQPHPQSRG